MKEQTVSFKYLDKHHEFSFTPEESDWWTSFTSKGLEFDVHYDEDYQHICVYVVIAGVTQTQKAVYLQLFSSQFQQQPTT